LVCGYTGNLFYATLSRAFAPKHCFKNNGHTIDRAYVEETQIQDQNALDEF